MYPFIYKVHICITDLDARRWMIQQIQYTDAVVERLIDTLAGLGDNGSPKLGVKTKVGFGLAWC